MLHLDVIFAPTKCHLVWEGEISSLFDDGEVFPEDFFYYYYYCKFSQHKSSFGESQGITPLLNVNQYSKSYSPCASQVLLFIMSLYRNRNGMTHPCYNYH